MTRPFSAGCKIIYNSKAGLLTHSIFDAFPYGIKNHHTVTFYQKSLSGAYRPEEHTAAGTVAESHGIPFSSPKRRTSVILLQMYKQFFLQNKDFFHI